MFGRLFWPLCWFDLYQFNGDDQSGECKGLIRPSTRIQWIQEQILGKFHLWFLEWGTLGLFTGFSILSGVEIIFYLGKIFMAPSQIRKACAGCCDSLMRNWLSNSPWQGIAGVLLFSVSINFVWLLTVPIWSQGWAGGISLDQVKIFEVRLG